jgi:hypothetical protein
MVFARWVGAAARAGLKRGDIILRIPDDEYGQTEPIAAAEIS